MRVSTYTGWLTLIRLKPKWMIIQALGKSIYIYIYIYITRKFTICYHGYGLLKRFSDMFQNSIIPCNQSTKSYLPGVSMYFPFTVTNFKVAVCHFLQAQVTAISGLSFSTISSTFLRKKDPSTVRLNKSIF